jgi:UDP-N-acetylmuramoyl-L-alanyl-D-glutamate--2,6-diaminopimelate ligase
VNFDVAAFTNLYQDHIGPGEHKSFDHYLSCKQKLFQNFSPKRIFYNADDSYALTVVQNPTAQTISVSMEKAADYQGRNLTFGKENHTLQVQFDMVKRHRSVACRLPFIGKENASNALLASAIALDAFGVSLDKCAKSLQNARISGRSEIIPLPCDTIAVIDYAHNGESLERLLSSLRLYSPARLICLFGSVGERTKLRREELSRVALRLADFSILTSDNPGTEPPELILREMEKPFENHKDCYISIPDRKKAINYAVSILSSGDILVLAGKGHENYQMIGKEKVPFSEREILISKIEHFTEKNRL